MSILVSALVIKSLNYVNGSMRGSRRNKIHPRGNLAIVRSIPAIFPQHLYPHPRETRGFRGIPAVFIPVHTSSLLVTSVNHAKTAELIEIQLGVWTRGARGAVRGGSVSHGTGHFLKGVG